MATPISSGFIPLFTRKFTVLTTLSLCGVTTVAITAATVMSCKDPNSLINKGLPTLKNDIDKVSDFFTNSFKDTFDALGKEYGKAGTYLDEAIKDIPTAAKELANTFGEKIDTVKTNLQQIIDNSEKINYFLFTLGNVIKPAFAHIPLIIRDSFLYNEKTKNTLQLLSVQKIVNVINKEGFSEFAKDLQDIAEMKEDLISQVTYQQGVEVLKIFREIREDDYDKFMKKVRKNIEKAKVKQQKDSNELLKDIFIGEEEVDKFPGNIDELKNKVQTLEETLKKIKGLSEEDITQLKNMLEVLKKSLEQQTTATQN